MCPVFERGSGKKSSNFVNVACEWPLMKETENFNESSFLLAVHYAALDFKKTANSIEIF